MAEEILIDEHTDDKPENKEKKKPIPRDVSGVGYITTSGTIRYCRTGIPPFTRISIVNHKLQYNRALQFNEFRYLK